MRTPHFAVVFLCAAFSSAQSFPQTCPDGQAPRFPAPSNAGIKSCGLDGDAKSGSAEAMQNDHKNNFCAQGDPAPIDIAKLTALEKSAESAEKTKKYKAGQPPPDRSFLASLGEGNAAVFEGYVFEARQECDETVNCGTAVPNADSSHDIHLYMLGQPRTTTKSDPVSKQDAEECTGFVVEMVPHYRPAEWTSCNVNDVASRGLRVRVTGQQMFDGSHVPCKGGQAVGSNPRRVTLWEIHPVYSFEVCPSGDCASGGWVSLESFESGKTDCKNPVCERKASSNR